MISAASGSGGEPTHAASGLRVIDIVRHAYEHGLNAGDGLGTPPIGRAGLEAAVNYCADRACDRDGVHCAGCRLKTDELGLERLDDFLKLHERVACRASGLTIVGGGPLPAFEVDSLEALARTWAGEEVFYLARRVHRRMHKERDRRGKQLPAAGGEDGPAIILVAPQMADNIGMVARAMANFDLDELRLVAARDGWPNEKVRAAASGANHVIDAASAFATTAAAVSDLSFVCATTARQRHMAKPVMTPAEATAEIRARIGRGERCGILFGAERQGLENDDIALADAVVMAPVNPRFASLNLAQAVLLVGYEWMKASAGATLGRVTTFEAPLTPGLMTKGSPPAAKDELFGFFEHLEAELDAAGFLKPADRKPVMVRNIRTMFARMGATRQEVRTLRGIVTALVRAHKRPVHRP